MVSFRQRSADFFVRYAIDEADRQGVAGPLTAERTPSNIAGNVVVHGFGDSCAIMAALS